MRYRDLAGAGVLALLLGGMAGWPASAGETVTYTYDALGRLKVASTSGTVNDGQAFSWCYDDAGNRTKARTNASGQVADCSSVPPPPPPSPAPSISVGNASVAEGSSVLFQVSLSAAHGSSISVSYATANGTAGSGDYTAKSGTLVFAAGETSKYVGVQTAQDTLIESNETFSLNLSSPSGGATIADGQGTGTIIDDDYLGGPMCGGVPC